MYALQQVMVQTSHSTVVETFWPPNWYDNSCLDMERCLLFARNLVSEFLALKVSPIIVYVHRWKPC